MENLLRNEWSSIKKKCLPLQLNNTKLINYITVTTDKAREACTN